MSVANRVVRTVARVTIEIEAPLSIATGQAGKFGDNEVVLDANDLPAIPATTLAGVVRNRWTDLGRPDSADVVFGFQTKDAGLRSRISFSWAHIHDEHDRPVTGLRPPDSLISDRILRYALTEKRDHVRLSHRGVVDGRGKFDRVSVVAGHRFTFEIEEESPLRVGDENRAFVDVIVSLLADKTLRFGGRTRSGLGAFRVIRWAKGIFDLSQSDQLEAYGALPSNLGEKTEHLMDQVVPESEVPNTRITKQLVLTAVEPWVVSGDDPPRKGDPDISPMTTSAVVWPNQERGQAYPELKEAGWYLLPGSAIKGALRHRTAYHLRVLRGCWAHKVSQPEDQPKGRVGDIEPYSPEIDPNLDGFAALFGCVNNGDEDGGNPGCVFVSDVRVESGARTLELPHVSIDRFTGGALPGFLFKEKVLFDAPISIDLEIDLGAGTVPADVRSAFDLAVADLCEGRLSLGGGFGRGLGWFSANNPAWTGPGLARWNGGDS